jgi:hypothetical protein
MPAAADAGGQGGCGYDERGRLSASEAGMSLDHYAEVHSKARKLYQRCVHVMQERGLPSSPDLPLVLRLLNGAPQGLNAAELQYYTGCHNVSYLTARLRAGGYATERRVPTDKRLIYVVLTDKGRDVLDELAAAAAS